MNSIERVSDDTLTRLSVSHSRPGSLSFRSGVSGIDNVISGPDSTVRMISSCGRGTGALAASSIVQLRAILQGVGSGWLR